MYPHATPSKTVETKQLKLKQMVRTQQIKEAHPWLSYDEAVKVLLYHHQGSMWIQNLERDKLERSMEEFIRLVKSKNKNAFEPFVEYVLGVYYNGADEYGNQIEESWREESFDHRWNKARAILLKSK
mgnify:CR=1 FL=1